MRVAQDLISQHKALVRESVEYYREEELLIKELASRLGYVSKGSNSLDSPYLDLRPALVCDVISRHENCHVFLCAESGFDSKTCNLLGLSEEPPRYYTNAVYDISKPCEKC
jgi:hypothetical protein